MYKRDNCPYCEKALKIIEKELNSSAHIIDIFENVKDHRFIVKVTGIATVPVIFFGSKLIGGCDDLIEYKESGKLEILMLTEENRVLKRLLDLKKDN